MTRAAFFATAVGSSLDRAHAVCGLSTRHPTGGRDFTLPGFSIRSSSGCRRSVVDSVDSPVTRLFTRRYGANGELKRQSIKSDSMTRITRRSARSKTIKNWEKACTNTVAKPRTKAVVERTSARLIRLRSGVSQPIKTAPPPPQM